MAKDPAILWYWSDWHSGTTTLSRFLKGCYMDLLHAQFNSGPLSLEEIKTVLSSDFGAAWPTLVKKFEVTPQGLFCNERLEAEKIKRKAFTKSRVDNLKGTKSPHMEPHMEKDMGNHMENENVNTNRSKDKGRFGNYKGNNYRPQTKIGIQGFDMTPSEYLLSNYRLFFERQFVGKGLNQEDSLLEFDNEYTYYEFKDLSHFQNSFKSFVRKRIEAKAVNNGKSNSKYSETISSASQSGNIAADIYGKGNRG